MTGREECPHTLGIDRRPPYWPALLVLGVTLAVLLFPLPRSSRPVRALTDMGHGPFFAALAALAWVWSQRGGSPVRARPLWFGLTLWAVLVALGAVAEILQGAVGRQPSWGDALANALGAGAGILWIAAKAGPTAARRETVRRWALRGLAGLCLALSVARPLVTLADVAWQRSQMPTLASFECPLELTRWSVQQGRMRRDRRHATDGQWSLRLDLGRGQYPGVTMGEPAPDWRGYRTLALDVALEGADSLEVVLKIADTPHNWEPEDRFERLIRLARGSQQIRVPLAEVRSAPVGRDMDLRQVTMVQIFAPGPLRSARPARPVRLYLDNLRLE